MSSSSHASATSRRSQNLRGAVTIPGDKSISHRALMLGALAIGTTRITGLLTSDDVMNTAAALRALGAAIIQNGDSWQVRGVGVGGFMQPEQALEMGNSGTSTRLLAGLVATTPITTEFTGDASLSKRPMARVTVPLSQMGAEFETTDGRLPMIVRGTDSPLPIRYELPVASAQIKSAILLAALNTPGTTTVIERIPTRDYTENILRAFGVPVMVTDLPDGGQEIFVTGYAELVATEIMVPADPSSAAFPCVAALLCPGSEIVMPQVGINPRRMGLYETLLEMGADITFENRQVIAGEQVADIRVRYSQLRGVTVPASRAPSMIDEFPVLAVAASCATGTTHMQGLHELRVKESDRLQTMADGLTACGARVEIQGDDLLVHGGNGQPPAGNAQIATMLDHRIAMSFLVLGLATEQPITIDDAACITTSFPNFMDIMQQLGASITA